MHFTRLRLHGFKSFVEPTDLHIGPGMTGIVGPNGCGKSNLVEALKWVMGENSAKSMRGGEMDDVIFGGTATRPARNLAEVALELDNGNRSASAEFNNDDTLLVTRQIERGNGSDYKVNGKPARRRDVQMLFADQSTGAHSTNLVGQGQIDALIRAKPQDRRQILEEASGTSGLQARRHEAELKLKGAEQNLTRVDDVLQSYDAQLRSLKTQVRQASRYRNLADHIRRTEAALLQLRWVEAGKNAETVADALAAAETRVAELLAVVTQGEASRTDIASELPALRQAEATAAAVVQKLTLAREQIDAEAKRIASEMREQEQRLAEAKGDRDRERARSADGEAAIVKLQEEAAGLAATQATIAEDLPRALEILASATQEVEALDIALSQLMQETATADARKQALQKELESLSMRRNQLAQRREQLDAQRVGLAAEAATRPDLALASVLVEATETELAKRQQQAQSAEQFYREAEQLQIQARDIAQKSQADVTKLRAESDALTALLQTDDHSEQVIDLISVTPGLENALAVAVGEALTAALDPAAAKHWRELPSADDAPALPQGAVPLAQFVQFPPALARCLSQIGLVEDAAAGEAVVHDLRFGQTLVSRDGWAWRWDGFTLTPQAKTATALRLQQRNRVAALQKEIDAAAENAQAAQDALSDSSAFLKQRQDEDHSARQALKAAFAALNDARGNYARQEKEATAITTKLAALDDTLRQLDDDLDSVRARALAIEDEQKALPDLDAARITVGENRARLAELRSQQAVKQSERDRLAREQNICLSRAKTVAAEIEAWQARLSNAAQQIEALATRIVEIESRLQELGERPAELEASRGQLLSQLSDAETKRKEAADHLIATELKLSHVEQQLKRDENALTEAREARVRAEGAVQAAAENFNALRERMTEKLNCGPEELPAIAGFAEGEALPALSELDQALVRYVRERENMGPVNLRAEVEAETMLTQIDTLTKEKDDLTAAIAKLRQGISQLNREARERLQNAFTLVNERFQILFKGLFGGGRAYLELVDGEDPMNAGLEIFASPPGKKMQALSLLSGGERTLTALALLFAVFQTNPSPICVLDEAEAALDESNIGRFCELVETIARETGTRFLIITHQRVTMAKMDRLFGVTMGEKGVSQLVSVDLEAAVAIRDGNRVQEALREVQAA
ncbi:MAG: chromosome segregation protein SMC [Alphaproteobacteria bacterium]|nr:chromosome segregation protein SMC [Alphaproteobacteria bacterium]